ncbi:uncharacterized protein G2W53_044219 [Senna tora]|uniref:NADH dehydrogenase subunit 4 n=1 Tax=Senna tora TaxID=362788 RepID=A0A834SM12_9FABA|nr:uncharacterized protein G2W53_044219 [Senna tora]
MSPVLCLLGFMHMLMLSSAIATISPFSHLSGTWGLEYIQLMGYYFTSTVNYLQRISVPGFYEETVTLF